MLAFCRVKCCKTPDYKKNNLENFELSQAYIQFWDKLEKANRTLELARVLKNEPPDSRKNALLLQKPIGNGGDWNYVKFLVSRYGLVPKKSCPTHRADEHSSCNSSKKGYKSDKRGSDSGS